jgi:hypothetical protein
VGTDVHLWEIARRKAAVALRADGTLDAKRVTAIQADHLGNRVELRRHHPLQDRGLVSVVGWQTTADDANRSAEAILAAARAS